MRPGYMRTVVLMLLAVIAGASLVVRNWQYERRHQQENAAWEQRMRQYVPADACPVPAATTQVASVPSH